MSKKLLYALTGLSAMTLRRCAREEASPVALCAADELIAVDPNAAVERMARVFADLEPGEPWPTNEELGGGPTGTRDDEYRHECMDHARAALGALLQEDE